MCLALLCGLPVEPSLANAILRISNPLLKTVTRFLVSGARSTSLIKAGYGFSGYTSKLRIKDQSTLKSSKIALGI